MLAARIAVPRIIRTRRHSRQQLEEMAGKSLPPVTAWFAFVSSCGLKVADKKAFAARVRESADFANEIATTVETPEGSFEYRLVAWDGHFHMRKPVSEREVKLIRLGNIKRVGRRLRNLAKIAS